jgi:hypothetical protein
MMRIVTMAFVATAVIAGAGLAPTVASAGSYGNRADVRADRQDLRADRQDIRRDRADLRRDFGDLRRDLRSRNRADFARDLADIRRDIPGRRSEAQANPESSNWIPGSRSSAFGL